MCQCGETEGEGDAGDGGGGGGVAEAVSAEALLGVPVVSALRHTVLYCTVLYCTALYCTYLHSDTPEVGGSGAQERVSSDPSRSLTMQRQY